MRAKFNLSLSLMTSFLLFAPGHDLIADNDEALIKKQTQEYAAAFNRQDPKGIAAIWAEKGKYIDPESGEVILGRWNIEETFRSSFENSKHSELKIIVHSVTFPSSDQAIERGMAVLKEEGETPVFSAFRAFFTKENNKWLITEVREARVQSPPLENEHLKELEWLIGDWVDEDQDSKTAMRGEWDKYKNFIMQHFQVLIEGTLALEGRQIIGWDPIQKKIRSWIFDSEGGYGEGMWKRQGSSWFVESKQTLADGRRASSINIYTPIDQDRYRWESTGREVEGELLPNVNPVTVVRKKG